MKCNWCGDEFVPRKGLKRFCSLQCRSVGVRQECKDLPKKKAALKK